jgi:DNA replication protein DnaC
MLTHPTLDQLRALKLDGMVRAFIELETQEETRNLAHAEWLALLLDRETADRGTRRFQTRLRAARLRHSQAAIEDVDYRTPRRLDKALFQQLATCRWIAEHRGLLVTGPCGVGKSWLSCALAQKACRDGYTVHYARVPRLFADLDLAHGDGRFARLSGYWSRSIFWCSTIGGPIVSQPVTGATSWRSSRIAWPGLHPHHQPTPRSELA